MSNNKIIRLVRNKSKNSDLQNNKQNYSCITQGEMRVNASVANIKHATNAKARTNTANIEQTNTVNHTKINSNTSTRLNENNVTQMNCNTSTNDDQDFFSSSVLSAQNNGETNEITVNAEIYKIVFYNEENNYCVLRIKVKDEILTATGNVVSPVAGECIAIKGEWVTNPKFGKQLKIISYTSIIPSSVNGIEKFLSSGFIPGIGKSTAKKIVEMFGEKTFEVIENNIESLLQINGINANKLTLIQDAWNEHKEIRQIIIFLQQYDISSSYAVKIFKHYRNEAITVIKENPYRLAHDIFGIGFLTADKIATKLGFDKNSIQRCESGVLYVLSQCSEDGHVFEYADILIKKSLEILKIDYEILLSALINLEFEGKIYCIYHENLNFVQKLREEDLVNDHNICIYLSSYYNAEIFIAKTLKQINSARAKIKIKDINGDIVKVQNDLLITLAQKQIEAVKMLSVSKTFVITGGPGTGKTTIIRAIINILKQYTQKISLTAPTGRAAKRMTETTGQVAKTIHRLLETNKEHFLRNETNPIDSDVIIIDESSMIDTILLCHLLKAIPQSAIVIFVGDINQLPSVGPGAVLHDIISSEQFPVVELNEIFRQAQKSKIIINSHRIISGEYPICADSEGTDFYFINEENNEAVTSKLLQVVHRNIPNKFKLDPIFDIQVLTPMNKGPNGSIHLNEELQRVLNPDAVQLVYGNKTYKVNDKVMQIKNNYDKDVFNGDIGTVVDLDVQEKELIVNFDGREVCYNAHEINELILAYAISIHKSQGSEYPAIVLPITTQHYIMLARNLLYTAITRGKRLVVLIGSQKAMYMAINNHNTVIRNALLCKMLKS